MQIPMRSICTDYLQRSAEMTDDKMIITPPLYMVGIKTPCWRCGAKMTVIGLLAPDVKGVHPEVAMLSNIEDIPKEVLSLIQKRVPTFMLKYSKTIREKYYANTCPKCKVIYGDFFLHGEPDSPLFPTSEDEARTLYVTEIPLSKPTAMRAHCGVGIGDLILKYAKKI